MSQTDSGRERRKNRRLDVSFPARFTADGRTIHRAVVRSLSAEGMFLETTTLVSIGTTIRVLAPLSDENPQPIRTKATVLYHNRRGTAGALLGFGLQFAAPPAGVAERIERFLDLYAGSVAGDETGAIAWPVEVPAIDPGWHPVSWWALDPETAEVESAHTSTEPAMERLSRWLGSLPEDVAAEPGARVAFHFHGKALAPASGVRRNWVEHPPLRKALVAQMWAIESLEAAEWKLIELGRERAAAIGAAARVLEAAREELTGPPPSFAIEGAQGDGGADAAPTGFDDASEDLAPSSDEVHDWNEVVISLADVSRFLDSLRYNLQGLPLLEPSAVSGAESPGDDFLRGALQDVAQMASRLAGTEPRAPGAEKDGAAEADSAAVARPGAGGAALTLSRRHVVALASVLALAAAAGITIQTLRSRPPPAYDRYLPIAKEALSALRARNADRLEDRIAGARAALGSSIETYPSTTALELGLAALRYLQSSAALDGPAQAMHDLPWGPGKRYPDRQAYEQWRERDRTRAEGWIDTSEQIAAGILNDGAPFARERENAAFEALEAGRQWLSERQHQVEMMR